MRNCENKSGVGETMAAKMTIANIAQRLFFANVFGDNTPILIKISNTRV
ncbi:Hypothetical protein DPCES_3078 [Desulfitobacterium hafniense]|uniref:Uncharacterized protein n=1 Tax=Desulfitobacterium hafniense TaxID=49338 RepID=A0A098B3K4_DESHA|nr:Hypothetical protein DPCES_3078 [Desulfitobacterium hafniense]